jgi:cell division protein FtsI (penicillin-binding protein 3)
VALGSELPDFTGFSKREVMAALEGSSIPLNLKGEGWVVFQFPPAGEIIDDTTTMFLEFK